MFWKDTHEDAHDNTTNATDASEDANQTAWWNKTSADIKEDWTPHNSSNGTYNGSHSSNITADNSEDSTTRQFVQAMMKDAK